MRNFTLQLNFQLAARAHHRRAFKNMSVAKTVGDPSQGKHPDGGGRANLCKNAWKTCLVFDKIFIREVLELSMKPRNVCRAACHGFGKRAEVMQETRREFGYR